MTFKWPSFAVRSANEWLCVDVLRHVCQLESFLMTPEASAEGDVTRHVVKFGTGLHNATSIVA